MKLYLVQHALAKSEQQDPHRGLSEEGRRELEKSAAFLAGLRPPLAEIRHSTKLRSKQSAQALAAALGKEALLKECQGLTPNDPVLPFLRELEDLPGPLMLVGHLPFLSKLASHLLCGDEASAPVAFVNAGIVCLNGDQGKWQVEWIVTPGIL